MKQLLILGVLAAAGTSGAAAQINSAEARGYYDRGVAMYADGNFNGCLDQLLQMRQLDPTAGEREDAIYYIAMATLYSGDDEALELLRGFQMRYPQSVRRQEVEASIGDYYFTRGNYVDAIGCYDRVDAKALTSNRAADTDYRRAYSLMMLGRNEEAFAAFGRLAGNRTYANAAAFYQGYIRYAQGQYKEAARLLKEVNTAVAPGNSALYYLSQIYFLEGDYAKSLELADKALAAGLPMELKQEMTRICGESLYNLGRTTEALPYLRSYVEAVPATALPSAYYMIGVCEFEDGNYAGAIPMLQRSAGTDDARGQSAYLYLGQAYVKEGRKDQALMAFDRAYKAGVDPQVTETALYNYIVARMEGGKVPFGSSAQMMEDFIKTYPNSTYASAVGESLATGYMSGDDYVNALRVLEGMKNPSAQMVKARQRALFMSGTRAYSNGDREQALQYFSQGADTKGGDANVGQQCNLWRGICLYDLGQPENAADELKSYISASKSNDLNRAQAYYTLGYCLMDASDWKEACKDFLKAADSDRGTSAFRADAMNRAADCKLMERDYKSAIGLYEKAAQMNPKSGDYALLQIASAKSLSHDFKGIVPVLDRLISEYPTSALVPEAMLAKSHAYVAMRQQAKADEVLEELVEKYPATSQGREGLLMLAISHRNSGENDAAADAYRKVIAHYPSSEEARTAMTDLKSIYAAEGRLADYAGFINSIEGMPDLDVSQLEGEAFAAAETDYIDNGNMTLMATYMAQYPNGANAPTALYYMSEGSFAASDFEKAEEYAAKLLSKYPDSEAAEDALALKAQAQEKLGKGEMAFESYTELERRASTPDALLQARLGLMNVATALGRNEDVVAVTGRLLSSGMANVGEERNVMFSRALGLDRMGSNAEADDIWRQLSMDTSDLAGSKSAVYLSESLLGRGDAAAAYAVADKFTDAGSPFDYWYARGFIVLSDALRAQGHEFEANEYLKNIRDNYPGTEADILQMIESRLNADK